MAMIRQIAREEVLDMAEQLRAAANVLERTADEIGEGSDIRPGMTATDAMLAVRAFHPKISDLCATVYQLRASVLRPEATPPPPSQPMEFEDDEDKEEGELSAGEQVSDEYQKDDLSQATQPDRPAEHPLDDDDQPKN